MRKVPGPTAHRKQTSRNTAACLVPISLLSVHTLGPYALSPSLGLALRSSCGTRADTVSESLTQGKQSSTPRTKGGAGSEGRQEKLLVQVLIKLRLCLKFNILFIMAFCTAFDFLLNKYSIETLHILIPELFSAPSLAPPPPPGLGHPGWGGSALRQMWVCTLLSPGVTWASHLTPGSSISSFVKWR